jgi:hypothetical protein
MVKKGRKKPKFFQLPTIVENQLLDNTLIDEEIRALNDEKRVLRASHFGKERKVRAPVKQPQNLSAEEFRSSQNLVRVELTEVGAGITKFQAQLTEIRTKLNESIARVRVGSLINSALLAIYLCLKLCKCFKKT